MKNMIKQVCFIMFETAENAGVHLCVLCFREGALERGNVV